jgi:3-hydroxyacyl-CoA dehydrogenase
MLERGEATAEDIDQAMELGTGHREYPFVRFPTYGEHI